jgi:hypothetical protein
MQNDRTQINNRFELEQQILNCWSIIDDIQVLQTVIESNSDSIDPKVNDIISNYLLGLTSIYQHKFERMFGTFEKCITSRVL